MYLTIGGHIENLIESVSNKKYACAQVGQCTSSVVAIAVN